MMKSLKGFGDWLMAVPTDPRQTLGRFERIGITLVVLLMVAVGVYVGNV